MGHFFQYKGISAMVVLAMLSACGGGGGSDTNANTNTGGGPTGAASCSALKSGTYRMVTPGSSVQTRTASLDATNLTLNLGAASATLTPVANANCRYTVSTGESLVVSSAGVGVFLQGSGTARQIGMIFPEQNLTGADLAGTWNALGFLGNGITYQAAAFVQTVDANGRVTASASCSGLSACVANPAPDGQFTANPAGGYDYTATDMTGTARAFFFRTGGGTGMVMLTSNGVIFASPQNVQALPATGSVANFWDVSFAATGLASADFIDSSTTVTAVDAASASYTRTRALDGRIDTIQLNKPRPGLRYRPAAAVTLPSGATSNVAETFYLPLQGLGVTVYNFSTSFGVSVGKP